MLLNQTQGGSPQLSPIKIDLLLNLLTRPLCSMNFLVLCIAQTTSLMKISKLMLCTLIFFLKFPPLRVSLKTSLSIMDAKKTTGVDGIPARILKLCARELSFPLTKLFNLSFSLGEVPLTWKRANITPVFKDNAKENVENYRSISLLSILGKCQERIIRRAIYSHVSPFLTDWQHGFVKGRSCTTQLVFTHHMWSKALDAGLQVDAVFLDFAKAFDRVHHKILLHKLCNFGVSGSLLAWCGDYLSNRK